MVALSAQVRPPGSPVEAPFGAAGFTVGRVLVLDAGREILHSSKA
jgi:hypothetical protein